MKLHRSTRLFLQCSGGEHSVKCVCPALEMEVSKKQQSGAVHFLVAECAGGRRVIGISGSLIQAKTLMELIFNPCGEFYMYI